MGATRRLILITGGAGVCVLGAGLARVLHSDLSAARAPWREAGTGFGDPRLDALSWAVLAPNPHNRQPWLIRLDGADALTIYCDPDRRLPETDPPNRQITIGLGAFLEILRMAAAEMGFEAQIAPFPEGEPWPALDARPVAHVLFVRNISAAKDPLFAAVPDRRTCRVPFDQDRPVEAAALDRLDAALREGDGEFEWVNDPGNLEQIKRIANDAWRIEVETPRTLAESTRLTRIGEKEINANPDGISLSGPVMEGMRAAGVLTREKMGRPGAIAYDETLRFYANLIDSAMAFGWLQTAGNTRGDQLRAGAGWVRLQLAATAQGLAMHPLSQALQEFPEMAEPFEEIHDFTGVRPPADDRAGRIQGLFRFGYAKPAGPSPRWPLRTRLIAEDA